MNALEPQIRAIVTELIDGFAARGSAEFISEFAHELPARVFLALMGWPLQDAPMFTEATDTTLHGIPGASEEESIAARAEAAGRMMNYFAAVVADRRSGSADASDVTASIINTDVEIDGAAPTTHRRRVVQHLHAAAHRRFAHHPGLVGLGHHAPGGPPRAAGRAGRRPQLDSCRSGRSAARGGGRLRGSSAWSTTPNWAVCSCGPAIRCW